MTSMMKSDGAFLAFFERPIAAALGVLTLGAWAWVLATGVRRSFGAGKPAAGTAGP
jgi:hypothetical protein